MGKKNRILFFFRTFRIAKPQSKFRFNVRYCQSVRKVKRYIHFGRCSTCWRDPVEQRLTCAWSGRSGLRVATIYRD